jgi:hypothetical protein
LLCARKSEDLVTHLKKYIIDVEEDQGKKNNKKRIKKVLNENQEIYSSGPQEK